MKKSIISIVLSILIILMASYVIISCNKINTSIKEQEENGILLKPNEKLVNVTFSNQGLWILTKNMKGNILFRDLNNVKRPNIRKDGV